MVSQALKPPTILLTTKANLIDLELHLCKGRRYLVHNLFRWFALQPEFGCRHRPPPCTTNWDSVAEQLLSLIRILIADDFEAWRREVCLLLRQRSELEIVCEASDGSEAVQKADDLKPDLIVLDIGLPKLNGIEAARRIRQLSPNSRILFLSQNTDLEVVQAALRTGALGYIHKMNAHEELLSAIDAVLLGKQFVGSGLTGRN
jgi:CheY-like chemotaxis protein